MSVISKISLAAALTTLSASVFASDISGTYNCKGTNPDGSEYEATAVIATGADHSFNIKWTVGGSKYEGTGVMNKKGDTLGGLFWGEDKSVGVLVYQMNPDNTLQGTWLMKDTTKPGYETCKKGG